MAIRENLECERADKLLPRAAYLHYYPCSAARYRPSICSVVHACEQLCTAASRRSACVERERFYLHVLCCKPRVAIGACLPCLPCNVVCEAVTTTPSPMHVMHRSKQLPGLSMPAAVKNGATVMSSIKGAECNTQSTGYRRRGPTCHTPIICLLGMLHGACVHACCAVPGGHKYGRKVTLSQRVSPL